MNKVSIGLQKDLVHSPHFLYTLLILDKDKIKDFDEHVQLALVSSFRC